MMSVRADSAPLSTARLLTPLSACKTAPKFDVVEPLTLTATRGFCTVSKRAPRNPKVPPEHARIPRETSRNVKLENAPASDFCTFGTRFNNRAKRHSRILERNEAFRRTGGAKVAQRRDISSGSEDRVASERG
jgi:hypothetical protein